jgi:hypothetical protein
MKIGIKAISKDIFMVAVLMVGVVGVDFGQHDIPRIYKRNK